ncbi:hypothetical protein BDZ45DRAFT_800389 [Acephala macrosclerotiorum]|nr:hypothetical protein BDZ45DRAFT_800389 [Acephala macrosclerotiorum]
MHTGTSTFGYSLLLSSLTATLSFSHPLSERAQLADCLYNNNPNFLNIGNLISTAEIEACTTALARRDLARIDNGPPPSPEDIIMKRGFQGSPLIVSGQSVAADTADAKRSLQARGAPPPDVGFFDDANDGTTVILTNFLEPGHLNSWSGPVCTTVAMGFDPTKTDATGIFNYNIQGTHKIADSLDHTGRFLQLLVTFTGTDPVLLPQYNVTALCQNAMAKAAQYYHELNYGAFGLKKVDSVLNFHKIEILPTETAGQVTSQTAAPASSSKRGSTFGAPIGIINIQLGDQANDVALFHLNGLPGK